MTAAELLVQVPTAFAASALFAVGGYALVGWASVAVCLAAARSPCASPSPRGTTTTNRWPAPSARACARRCTPRPLRLTVLAVALVGGLDAVEEYFPVLAGDQGVAVAAVPFAVLAIALAGAARCRPRWPGRAAARRRPARAARGRGRLPRRRRGAARPAALAAVAVFYGLYLAVLVVAETRLQDRIDSAHRATITSVAGLGIELASLLVFAAWALGGAAAVAVLVLAVVPVVRSGLRIDRARRARCR